MMRSQFASHKGWGQDAVFHAPSREEYEQLKRAVAIMTPAEKQCPEKLTDQQLRSIADDARTDPALLAIFINAYSLKMKDRTRKG